MTTLDCLYYSLRSYSCRLYYTAPKLLKPSPASPSPCLRGSVFSFTKIMKNKSEKNSINNKTNKRDNIFREFPDDIKLNIPEKKLNYQWNTSVNSNSKQNSSDNHNQFQIRWHTVLPPAKKVHKIFFHKLQKFPFHNTTPYVFLSLPLCFTGVVFSLKGNYLQRDMSGCLVGCCISLPLTQGLGLFKKTKEVKQ